MRERGQALLGALLALFLVSVAGALLAGALELKLRTARQAAKNVRLSAFADAACAAALAELSQSQGSRPLTQEPLDDGMLYYRTEWLGSRRYRVLAGATYGGGERWLEVEVRLSGSSPRVVSWQRVPGGPAAFSLR